MKKLLLLFFLLTFQFLSSQNETERLSIKFEDSSLEDVLQLLESKTHYKFFYYRTWLGDAKVSGDYQDWLLTEILDNIFEDTVLNYFITEDRKIILTENTAIHTELPKGFFDTTYKTYVMVDPAVPILLEEDITTTTDTIGILKVGKEDKANQKSSHTLSGYIVNAETKKPLPDVVISIKDSNENTITNSEGFYSLAVEQGEQLLIVKLLGFQELEKKLIVYNDEYLNFSLTETAERLEEVVVDARVTKENLEQAITGVTKIEVEQIKNIPLVLGERDILKVALTLPSVKTAGEGSAGYNVRGGKADQNLILLDDNVLYNPSHFFGIFSALNPFSIGDATIYTGTIPADYGGRLSSVFDIRTKRPNTEKFSGEVSIGPVTGNVMLEVPIVKGKSSLLIGGRGTYSDWILKEVDNESISKSNASFYDGILKYNHVINDKNWIEATGYYSKDNFSISSDSLYSYSNRLMSVNWKSVLSERQTSNFLIGNSEYKFNVKYEGDADRNFMYGYKVTETQAKLRLNYRLGEQHEFDYGISSKLYTVYPGNIQPKGTSSAIEPFEVPKEKGLESAIFLSDKFNLNEKVLLDVGLRYSIYNALGSSIQNKYKPDGPKNMATVIDTLVFKNNEIIKTYGGPEVRFSVRYFLSPTLSLKSSFNNTYQYIHMISNNTTVSPIDTWKLSDYNIEPQRASQISLGVFKNYADNNIELSLEGYFKKMNNILDYKVGADLLLNENIETEVIQGRGKAYGIEFFLKKNVGKLNGWIGYSYSRSLIKLDSKFNEEIVNNGNYFPANFDKPHDFSLIGNYKFTKRYSISANFMYQTGRPVTFPTGNYVFNGSEYVAYSDRNAFRVPDYYRLDIGFNIEGNHRIKKFAHSFWNISIYNVLGRNNPYSIFFVTENGNIKAYKSSIFSVPIPTITYNFRF